MNIRILKESFGKFLEAEYVPGMGENPLPSPNVQAPKPAQPQVQAPPPKPKKPLRFGGIITKLTPPELDSVLRIVDGTEEIGDDQVLWDKLFNLYRTQMPYSIQKAHTADPYDWVLNKLQQEFSQGETNV